MMQRTFTWGEVDDAFAQADHVIEQKFRWNRMGANPTETFGCITEWNPRSLDMTIRASIQAPSFTALARAAVFQLPTNKVRLITYPHGGSFRRQGTAARHRHHRPPFAQGRWQSRSNGSKIASST